MTEVVKLFSNVSEAKAWVSDRITETKNQLDNKQTSIFESLDGIESQISANKTKNLEELEKLKAYKEQTISLFGPSAANISIIDSKITELSGKVGCVGKNGKDTNYIKLIWSDAPLTQLVSSIGSVELELDTSPAIKPLVSPLRNKPKLKPNLSTEDSFPRAPPKERYVTCPSASLSHDPSLFPPRPQEVTKNGSIKFEVESDYVVDSLYSNEQSPVQTHPPDSPYTNMSGILGDNYYIMDSVPCSSPPLGPDDPVPKLPHKPLTPPLTDPSTYEDIADFGDEDNNQLKPLKFPKYPMVVKCPEGCSIGCIMKPKTLCVNPANGNLYVVEKGNCRVQILTPDGDHVKFFADKSGSNKMSGPYGICIANNHVYVTQSALNCVHIYTPNGMFVRKFGREGSKEGRFCLPSSLAALSTKKQILICDTGNNRVQTFDFSHNFCRILGAGQLLKPVDIACDASSKIIVLDRGPKCIHVFGQSGDLLYNTVSFSMFKQLSNPLFMTLGPQGNIFLSDYSRNTVFVFSMDGVMQGQIGAEGVLVEPRGLVFDTSGRLVVLSCNHSGCLQFFDV